MQTIYMILLFGVYGMLSLVVFDAVRTVSRKAPWTIANAQANASGLSLVDTPERRQNQLPFVGADRRKAAEVEEKFRRAA